MVAENVIESEMLSASGSAGAILGVALVSWLTVLVGGVEARRVLPPGRVMCSLCERRG